MDTPFPLTKRECQRCYALVENGALRGICKCNADGTLSVFACNPAFPCLLEKQQEALARLRSIETPPDPDVVDEVLETNAAIDVIKALPDAVSDREVPCAPMGTTTWAPTERDALQNPSAMFDEPTDEDVAEMFMPGLLAEPELLPAPPVLSKAGYEPLADILIEAYNFAAYGKGHERHAGPGLPWEQQRIFTLTDEFGLGFPLGQAGKKLGESQRLDKEAAERELLGAISYIAAAVHKLRKDDY